MKSLLPSFILILLYFIAEEFFVPKFGLIAVIVLGAGEFFYSCFCPNNTELKCQIATMQVE